MTTAGLLSMALNKLKLMYAIGVPRNLGSKQNNSQKKMFLFPGLQETVKTPVVLELMKIIQQYLLLKFTTRS